MHLVSLSLSVSVSVLNLQEQNCGPSHCIKSIHPSCVSLSLVLFTDYPLWSRTTKLTLFCVPRCPGPAWKLLHINTTETLTLWALKVKSCQSMPTRENLKKPVLVLIQLNVLLLPYISVIQTRNLWPAVRRPCPCIFVWFNVMENNVSRYFLDYTVWVS